jgi:hypothetical protein
MKFNNLGPLGFRETSPSMDLFLPVRGVKFRREKRHMKRTPTFGAVVLLLCVALPLARGDSPSTHATAQIGLEVLSATQGVDFGPFCRLSRAASKQTGAT